MNRNTAIAWLGSFFLVGCTSLHDMRLEQGSWQPLHHTLKELRDRNLIKQQEDYSCGASALATLMIYYFGEDTSEKELLALLENELSGQEKNIKMKQGFSLLDLKRVAMKKGYRAAGYKVTMSQLTKVSTPVMIFLEPLGYKHFAVYRGIDRGRIYVADPARGNLRMSIGRFLDEWSGIIFVLGKEGQEQITQHALQLPHPLYIQPELARINGLLDVGLFTQTLPQR